MNSYTGYVRGRFNIVMGMLHTLSAPQDDRPSSYMGIIRLAYGPYLSRAYICPAYLSRFES